MRLNAIVFTFGIAASALPHSLVAQRRDSLSIPLGARVRVLATERPPGKLVGTFHGSDSAFVRIVRQGDGRIDSLVWSKVRSIDVLRRRRSSLEAFHRGTRAGAVVAGSVAALGVVAAVAYDLYGHHGTDYYPYTPVVAVEGILFTVAGTVVGGVLALPFRNSWRQTWPVG